MTCLDERRRRQSYQTCCVAPTRIEQLLLERHGIKLLAIYTYPAQVLFCREPFSRLADIAGRRVRSSAVAMSEFLGALGARPIAIPFAETHAAFARGAIDCAVTGTLSGFEIGLGDHATHQHTLAVGLGLSIFGANIAAWRALPPTSSMLCRPAWWTWSGKSGRLPKQIPFEGPLAIPEASCAASDVADAWSQFKRTPRTTPTAVEYLRTLFFRAGLNAAARLRRGVERVDWCGRWHSGPVDASGADGEPVIGAMQPMPVGTTRLRRNVICGALGTIVAVMLGFFLVDLQFRHLSIDRAKQRVDAVGVAVTATLNRTLLQVDATITAEIRRLHQMQPHSYVENRILWAYGAEDSNIYRDLLVVDAEGQVLASMQHRTGHGRSQGRSSMPWGAERSVTQPSSAQASKSGPANGSSISPDLSIANAGCWPKSPFRPSQTA